MKKLIILLVVFCFSKGDSIEFLDPIKEYDLTVSE